MAPVKRTCDVLLENEAVRRTKRRRSAADLNGLSGTKLQRHYINLNHDILDFYFLGHELAAVLFACPTFEPDTWISIGIGDVADTDLVDGGGGEASGAERASIGTDLIDILYTFAAILKGRCLSDLRSDTYSTCEILNPETLATHALMFPPLFLVFFAGVQLPATISTQVRIEPVINGRATSAFGSSRKQISPLVRDSPTRASPEAVGHLGPGRSGQLHASLDAAFVAVCTREQVVDNANGSISIGEISRHDVGIPNSGCHEGQNTSYLSEAMIPGVYAVTRKEDEDVQRNEMSPSIKKGFAGTKGEQAQSRPWGNWSHRPENRNMGVVPQLSNSSLYVHGPPRVIFAKIKGQFVAPHH
ncbi:hypothetical protein B0H12DRAFT_1222112, partial [Mycena haematopus]